MFLVATPPVNARTCSTSPDFAAKSIPDLSRLPRSLGADVRDRGLAEKLRFNENAIFYTVRELPVTW